MKMSKPRYILGIDPDVDRTGVALVDCEGRRLEYAGALTFADCVKYLDGITAMYPSEDVKVVIEDSDTSTNWHCGGIIFDKRLAMDQKVRKAAAIGRSAGLCHATARHLREYAESCGLRVVMQRPLKKCWKGKDKKITQAEAAQFMPGLPKKCNQEVRDAALISWCAAELPIILKVKSSVNY